MTRAKDDLTGKKFGRLTVLHQTGKDHNRHIIWFCRCDCGRYFKAAGNLGANTNSCGCLRREKAARQAIKRNYRHGGAVCYNRSRLYQSWTDIKQRCLNPKNKAFKHYGNRGVTMAPEWADDFIVFRNYVKQNLGRGPSPKHTIDRIENDEGYFPGNIKWSTKSQQGHNSRQSVVIKAFDAILADLIKPKARNQRQSKARSGL